MRLTVIGANGAVPRPGGACSGYLVEAGTTKVLLDCGTGVYSRLPHHVDPFTLDAIVISHLHPDHFFDLVPFRYALRYALRDLPPEPPPLWLPPGGVQGLERFVVSFGAEARFFSEVFALCEYDPAATLAIGDLTVSFRKMPHYVPSFGMRIAGDALLAYSADTAVGGEVVELATGADFFLCEATAQEITREQTKAGHLSAADAGSLAAQSGVPRLLLTHVWHELDPRVSLEEARPVFDAWLDVAEEGRTYEVAAAER